MGRKRTSGRTGGMAATVALASLVLAGLPTAGWALDSLGDKRIGSGTSGNLTFTPASIDPRVARLVGENGSSARLLRFTPAGLAERPNRSVTVAVRIDEDAAHAIQVRSAIDSAKDQLASSAAVRIAPTRYNLGISRGYQSFAQPTVIDKKLSAESIPDLATFRPSPGAKPDESRFATRIALEAEEKTGSAPLTRDSIGAQSVDVGGSYRLTRNLDVTAGVRYEQDRNRLAPLADAKQNDSQAVYIGTQFKF